MKIWLRICGILIGTLLIIWVLVSQEVPDVPDACCLCNTTRHHAPCLVDLETGTVTELAVYDPHPTITGELAEEQYTTGTFSFVTCGEAQGYRDTTLKRIEIAVPCTSRSGQVALCAECLTNYAIPEERYILMDIYDKEKMQAISLVDAQFSIRCYEVIVNNNREEIVVTITGTMK